MNKAWKNAPQWGDYEVYVRVVFVLLASIREREGVREPHVSFT